MIKFKFGLFNVKFNRVVFAFVVVLIVIVVILMFRLIKNYLFFPPLLLYSPCCKIMPLYLNTILNIFPADSCMLLELIIIGKGKGTP